jgi:hypothetical protein
VNDNDPTKPITIKVTENAGHAYFVHFDRNTHALIEVFEYKRIYTPIMGHPAQRTQLVVDLAKSRIGMPLEENQGEQK